MLFQYRSLAFIVLLAWLSVAKAEQKVTFADYDVHYSVFNSRFLTPEIAGQYGILRSRNRAVINITVLNTRTQPLKASSALVSGKATNLIQQTIPLTFRKIREGKAIYYISELSFSGEQRLRFDIQVQPDPNKAALTVTFEQELYSE